ncbi:hypothetical protein HMPREF9695_00437 [Afipia broomeae ATCC 49717]|uniref:Uncharacterized protein n=1 Tax=Afipia broomeae ATCC 49717 TaxID=883078 RepID=K8PPB7_9BRAD|nr:hypothetical protein HMPREF9695_00437 [Afipia broomeae ATCC 49717]
MRVAANSAMPNAAIPTNHRSETVADFAFRFKGHNIPEFFKVLTTYRPRKIIATFCSDWV